MNRVSNGTAGARALAGGLTSAANTSGDEKLVGRVPEHQADGAHPPLRDNLASHLRNAVQIIDLGRVRLASGTEVFSLTSNEIRGVLDHVGAALVLATTTAPDPARADLTTTLADMERTNRELNLTGDQLAAEQEVRS